MSYGCKHEKFDSYVVVNRFSDKENLFSIDLKVKCVQCDTPLVFKGIPCGLSSEMPCGSADATEVRLPAYLQGEFHAVGTQLAGFKVRNQPIPNSTDEEK